VIWYFTGFVTKAFLFAEIKDLHPHFVGILYICTTKATKTLIKPANIATKFIQPKTILVCFVACFTLLLPAPALHSQAKLAIYEAEKEQIEKELEHTGMLITRTRDVKDASLSHLAVLKATIESRQRLIGNYHAQQRIIQDTIFSKIIDITRLSDEIDLLRAEYAKMIQAAHRQQHSGQQTFYLLAAENLQQAANRMNYIRAYTENRKSHIAKIAAAEQIYTHDLLALESKLNHNRELIINLNKETAQLNHEVALKRAMIDELAGREEQLNAAFTLLHEKHERLKEQIERVIAEDLAEKPNKEQDIEYLELMRLTSLFEDNWGKLPWPAEFGIITMRFGEQDHPELNGVKIRNNGINILTKEGASARAVFEGVVTRVMSVSNFRHVVIIRHGDFLTVYSNLSNVAVERGEKVEIMQKIGDIFTDREQAKTELHFELWKGKEQLNPLFWLAKSNDAVHTNIGGIRQTTFD
jgi:murein hydrolase activator